jgi:hypothetical protein
VTYVRESFFSQFAIMASPVRSRKHAAAAATAAPDEERRDHREDKCGVCGSRFTGRSVDPAVIVPEFAADIQSAHVSCCGWHCALQLTLSFVTPGRRDQCDLIRVRFSKYTS